MSLRVAQAVNERGSENICAGRRSRKRYALDIALTYRVPHKRMRHRIGTGRSINISSSGIAFLTADIFSIGTHLELSLSWPVLLNDSCSLKLVVDGTVVRSDGKAT